MQDVMSYKVAKQQYWRNNSLREATMGLQNPKASARRQTSKVTWRSRPTAQSNHINFPTQTRAQHPLCPDIWPENANVPKELRAQTHQAATWRQSMRFASTELPENINAWRQQLKTNFTKWILNSSARPTVEWSEHDPRQSHNRCAAISDDVYWWFLRHALHWKRIHEKNGGKTIQRHGFIRCLASAMTRRLLCKTFVKTYCGRGRCDQEAFAPTCLNNWKHEDVKTKHSCETSFKDESGYPSFSPGIFFKGHLAISYLYSTLPFSTVPFSTTLPYSALLLKILKPFSALLFSTLLLTNLTLGF